MALDRWLNEYIRMERGQLPNQDEHNDSLPRFHYPVEYLVQTWSMLHNHHILPRQGGWDDQCALWADDISTLTGRYNMIYAQIEAGQSDDDIDRAFGDVPAREW